MIRIQESVPGIYYNSSRDFQLLGHFFDLVLNSTKTEADLLFNLPLSQNSDDQLLDLMTFTLGLRLNKAKYTSRQLRSICSVAPKMMRLKGSRQAVSLLCTALMRADAAEGNFSLELNDAQTELTVYITSYATCRDALQELLPYILPAGMTFRIKESSEQTYVTTTKVNLAETVKYGIYNPGDSLGALVDPTSLAEDLVTQPEEFKLGDAKVTNTESNNNQSLGYEIENIIPGLITTTIVVDPSSMSTRSEDTINE